jgi:hypothetical protein
MAETKHTSGPWRIVWETDAFGNRHSRQFISTGEPRGKSVMADKRNDGGPAFPCEQTRDEMHGDWNQTFCPGMSLRDWFAGQALAGLVANPTNHLRFNSEDDAEYVYKIADAMLAEGEKRDG